MAYVVEGNYFGNQSHPIVVSSESSEFFDQDRLNFGRKEGFHSMCMKVPYTHGFKMPMPANVYIYNTKLKRSEFHAVMSAGADLLITSEVIEVLESLEPGLHSYFPVKINASDGEVGDRYYLLNVGSQLKTVIFEDSPGLSNTEVSEGREDMFYGFRYILHNLNGVINLEEPASVTSCAKRISTHHLWHEYGWVNVGEIFISDTLYNALSKINAFKGGLQAKLLVGEK